MKGKAKEKWRLRRKLGGDFIPYGGEAEKIIIFCFYLLKYIPTSVQSIKYKKISIFLFLKLFLKLLEKNFKKNFF